MNPFDLETIQLILVFFVPGFISLKVYDLIVPAPRRDFSASLLEAVSFSCINFALIVWPAGAILAAAESPVLYYASWAVPLFVAPVLWPLLYLWITNRRWVRKRIIHPIPKPWDYVFSQKESYWVIVHLKDGRRVGGRYDTKSFASSYPAEEQIYLEEGWELDDMNRFVKRVDRSRGVLVSSGSYDIIEFFVGGTESNGQEGQQ